MQTAGLSFLNYRQAAARLGCDLIQHWLQMRLPSLPLKATHKLGLLRSQTCPTLRSLGSSLKSVYGVCLCVSVCVRTHLLAAPCLCTCCFHGLKCLSFLHLANCYSASKTRFLIVFHEEGLPIRQTLWLARLLVCLCALGNGLCVFCGSCSPIRQWFVRIRECV